MMLKSKLSSATDESVAVCPEGYSGHKAGPGCQSYFVCSNGALASPVMNCQPGTLFNELVSTCDFEASVDCGSTAPPTPGPTPGPTESPTPRLEPTTSTPTLPPQTRSPSANAGLEDALDNATQSMNDKSFKDNNGVMSAGSLCMVGYTGWEARPGCQEYYKCENGEAGPIHNCGEGLLFDRELELCNFASSVDCVDKVGSTTDGNNPPLTLSPVSVSPTTLAPVPNPPTFSPTYRIQRSQSPTLGFQSSSPNPPAKLDETQDAWSTTPQPTMPKVQSDIPPAPQLLLKEGRRLEIENADNGRNDINNDNANQSEHQTQQTNDQVEDENKNSNLFFILSNTLLSLTCVIFAALAAGLTMGLLSLDPLSLEIKRRASVYSTERKQSAELLPLLVGHGRKHRLLVSLLILNSLANEALPLFLDELLPGKYASILVSVTLVLFFGEIVPSAFFTGPNQVKVAAKLVPIVKVVMFLLAPIAIPIAKLLDYVLHEGDDQAGGSHGEDLDEVDVTGGTHYDRSELTALVRIQHEARLAKKRRTKLLNQKMLASTNAGQPDAKRGARVTIATSHHPNHPPLSRLGTLTSQGSHASSTTNNSIRNNINTNSVRNDVRLAHHSIRSISRELTSSTTSSTRCIDGRGRKSPTPNYSHYHATPTTTLTESYTPKRMPSIHADEITMVEGALAMTTKVAADVATPLRRVYALPADTILDEATVVEIWARGFSRVPVFLRSKEVENHDDGDASPYDEDVSSMLGVLLVRQLIVVNANENRPLATLPLAVPPCVAPSMHLVDLINLFQAGGGRGRGGIHLAVVCARPLIATEALERGECMPKAAGVIGIVTLEDVVEELLQEEIYDEYDRDLELAHWGAEKWKSFVQRKKSNRLHLQDVDTSGAEGKSSGPRVTISNASAVDVEAPTTEASSLLDAVASWQDIAE